MKTSLRVVEKKSIIVVGTSVKTVFHGGHIRHCVRLSESWLESVVGAVHGYLVALYALCKQLAIFNHSIRLK